MLTAVSVLITAAGCTATDDAATVPVPSTDTEAAKLCAKLHAALPDTVNGVPRNDPEPRSELTAGWGNNPAMVLRCGVARPAEMSDPNASAVTVSGVNWLLQEQDDGAFRFTTTYREAYVEMTLPKKYAADVTPLMPLGPPIEETVPSSL
jgi:hypothetical protein